MSEKIMDPQAKKYKRKLITYIVLAVSTVAIIFFVVLAYIGSLLGNYTISLKSDGMSLSMADNRNFDNATSRLRATSIPYTLPIMADDLPDDSVLDDTDGSHNGVVADNEFQQYYGDGMFLAYTFYMRNLGVLPIAYEHIIAIEDMFVDEDGRGLDDILRVRFYENTVYYNDDGTITTTHEFETYAKIKSVADTVKDPDNEGQTRLDNRECISRSENENWLGNEVTVCTTNKEENSQRANLFYSEREIIHNGANGDRYIHAGETKRFTIVGWLEGWDPDAQGEVPYNPSITLSSQIIALHNLESEDQEINS